MTGAELYSWLMASCPAPACERFDAHVVASLFAVAFSETQAQSGGTLCDALGLAPPDIAALAHGYFPHALPVLRALSTPAAGATPHASPDTAAEDDCLRDLLARSATAPTPFALALARVVARRCQRPNHLWQDLGLRNRRELSWLMDRHFAPLAARNARDMKWKKFLYRTICRDDGFALCTAPSCAECDDFAGCFGDESGESLLAAVRRDAERGGRIPAAPDAAPTRMSQTGQTPHPALGARADLPGFTAGTAVAEAE